MKNGKKFILEIDGKEIDCEESESIELSHNKYLRYKSIIFEDVEKSLDYLGISEFKDRIFNAHPYGEIFFLVQYKQIEEGISKEDVGKFKDWFNEFVLINESEHYINVFFVNVIHYLNESLK